VAQLGCDRGEREGIERDYRWCWHGSL
jgi:hypothetical protein